MKAAIYAANPGPTRLPEPIDINISGGASTVLGRSDRGG